ncbi:MAG: DUF2867 domain-containing protein [Chloroflexota bacterium]
MKMQPEFASLFENADSIDVKTVEGTVNLRQFLAAMIAYQPGWIILLYRLRAVFVRFLGMKQEGMPHAVHVSPEAMCFTPGEKLMFFTTRASRENEYWFGDVRDQHLNAALGVVVERLSETKNRFHLVTIVHYNNWAGPIYFNVIRPFHHLVVGQMARAGVS